MFVQKKRGGTDGGEVSMKKNQRVGGMCTYACVCACVVHGGKDGSLLVGDVPERNQEGGPD